MSWKIRFESVMYDCPHKRWYEVTSNDEIKYFCYEPEYGKGEKECNEAECPLRIVNDDEEAEKMVAGSE